MVFGEEVNSSVHSTHLTSEQSLESTIFSLYSSRYHVCMSGSTSAQNCVCSIVN